MSALPFNGIILAHSNESEWVTFRIKWGTDVSDAIFISPLHWIQ
ncbi:hypothetical protein O5626_30745 [Escherichia coli]|nr:hypothetical protein [Escherichia coli]